MTEKSDPLAPVRGHGKYQVWPADPRCVEDETGRIICRGEEPEMPAVAAALNLALEADVRQVLDLELKDRIAELEADVVIFQDQARLHLRRIAVLEAGLKIEIRGSIVTASELKAANDALDWIAQHCNLDQSSHPDVVELRWYDGEGDEGTTRVPAVGVPGEARYDPCAGLRAAVRKAQEEETTR